MLCEQKQQDGVHIYMMATNKLRILLVVLGFIYAQNIFAVLPHQIQADEVNMLPPYCGGLSSTQFTPDAYKIFINKPKSPGFGPHMHHFCGGKKFVIRANNSRGNKTDRDFYLSRAVAEFDYVLTHLASENKGGRYNRYLAITSMEKAKVLQMQNMLSEAMQMYQQAIKYNPKLPQAYAGLSDIYKTQGMNSDAREILELGLKRIPKSKSLQRRLDKL